MVMMSRSGNPNKKIFVGNLSWEVQWQDLKDHFKQIGEVAFADVMTERGTGRSKGCGIVEFTNEDDVADAVEQLNESELCGRKIFVKADSERTSSGGLTASGSNGSKTRTVVLNPGADNGNSRVYIGNLDWSVDWTVLKTYLKQYGGSLVRVDVPTNDEGRSRGYGIAEYSNPEDAAEIIRLVNDSMLNGRKMHVREDRESKETGVSTGGGSSYSTNPVETKVFIGNVPYETTWQELKDFCRRAGEVSFADIPTNNEGKSRGFGIVGFASAADAANAIEVLNGGFLRGRNVFVREEKHGR